jgi:hypothetical protein
MIQTEKQTIALAIHRLNTCAKHHLGKIVITIFALNIAETILAILSMRFFLPALSALPPVISIIATVFMTLTFLTTVMLLFYGLNQILIRLSRRDFVTFGFLFDGFRHFKALFRYAITFAAILFASVFILSIAIAVFRVNPMKDGMPNFLTIGLLVIAFFLLIAALFFPFSFVWCILSKEPEKQKAVFRRSRSLLKGRKLLFLKIFFKALAPRFVRLFATIVALFLFSTMSSLTKSSLFALLSAFSNFYYVFTLYSTQAFLYLLIPIVYDIFMEQSAQLQIDFVDIKCLSEKSR